MPAPDEIILRILINNTTDGNTDPLAATAELAELYRSHYEWFDRLRCASADIESYKKRNAFKWSGADGVSYQEDFYTIVVLGEGKERLWSFRGHMNKLKILQRIALIQKKDEEHHEATLAETAYWKRQL